MVHHTVRAGKELLSKLGLLVLLEHLGVAVGVEPYLWRGWGRKGLGSFVWFGVVGQVLEG